MGLQGFVGNESILYHLVSPCRVKEVGEFEPIVRDEWVPDGHAHRHFRTAGIPAAGDAVTGRKLLMWNNDVEIALCRPTETMEHYYRNGEGDEVVFVHEGSGTATCRTARVTTSSFRAGQRIASPPRVSSATSSSPHRG